MDSFHKQIAAAHNKQFSHKLASSNISKIDSNDIKNLIKEPDFEYYMNKAYDQHSLYNNRGIGYSVRWNPHTGQHEMFVAGSQGWKDWVLNATDTVLYGGEKLFGNQLDKTFESETGLPSYFRPHLEQLDRYRTERSQKIKNIAELENVDVIYGHSRGGAVVADLDYKGRKVGIDAAMIISKNSNMENYHTGSIFDETLGIGGKKNIIVDSGDKLHWAIGDSRP